MSFFNLSQVTQSAKKIGTVLILLLFVETEKKEEKSLIFGRNLKNGCALSRL